MQRQLAVAFLTWLSNQLTSLFGYFIGIFAGMTAPRQKSPMYGRHGEWLGLILALTNEERVHLLGLKWKPRTNLIKNEGQ